MTALVKRHPVKWLLTTLAIVAGVALAGRLAAGAGTEVEPREVVVVARSMAFFVEGQAGANPTLRVRAGERIRIVLRNEDQGMTHDFAVRDWRVATRALQGTGTDEVTFTVPTRPGRYEYLCSPHASMMRGVIHVE